MEKIQYNKISETELEVTKPIPAPEVITTKYERSFIEQQIIQIQKSKDEFDILRDKELDECNKILVEMDKQGIISKPIEVTLEDNIGVGFKEEIIN